MCYCRCDVFAVGVRLSLEVCICYCTCEVVTVALKLLLQE